MSTLSTGVVFLGAAVVAVPIFQKFKLGAILGYLVAGLLIGPSVLNLVSDPNTILHFAELGVVLLLFVIGLELEPAKLWRMRNHILLAGGGQLLISALVIGALLLAFGYALTSSVVIALAVALSSTAFAIQLMADNRILKTSPGQKGFAILLMQDLAVIPILLLVETLSTKTDSTAPDWWITIGAILIVLFVGRFLINPFLRLVSSYGNAEVMTAAALLIVIATALIMDAAGLSMGMGAFVAGMLLANSSFRHQLEMEIEPFKGLLLGLFFIAIGMNLDLGLLIAEPLFIIGCAVLLVFIKTSIIVALLTLMKECKTDAVRIALMLSQGGEFAFVVMAQATAAGVLTSTISAEVTLIVGVSMALTSPLVILHSMWFSSQNSPALHDSDVVNDEPQVLIAGFGRFGQITGRILTAKKIPFTALDKDAEHIEFVSRFGNKVYFGDATRIELLKRAGIESVRVMLIAVDDETHALNIARTVHREFPHVKLVCRIRNRMNVNCFADLGQIHLVREMFGGSLEAAEKVLLEYGFSQSQAEYSVQLFKRHDEAILQDSLVNQKHSEQERVLRAKENREDLEKLFEQDKADIL
ncbi:MAG: monovalent cation:proton antiporter-2 (CPA2) family protein [Aestuariibacter sp.]